jgi:hypothetical protein
MVAEHPIPEVATPVPAACRGPGAGRSTNDHDSGRPECGRS